MTSEHELERLSIRSSVRFQYVVLPFDVRDFSMCLLELGYQLHKSLHTDSAGSPPSVGLTGSGTVGMQDGYLVDINTDRQFFGVKGGDPSSAFGKLTDILSQMESKGFTHTDDVHFYELQGQYKVPLEGALQAMYGCGSGSKIAVDATKVFERKMALFSARIVAEDSKLDSPDYMEILVQPLIPRPESRLGIGVTYRNPDFSTYEGFVSKIEEKIINLIQCMV